VYLAQKLGNIAIFDYFVLQVHGIYIWLPWLPDLCKLNQNKADSEFILSPSELMSGRGVSLTSKLWIRFCWEESQL